MSEHKTFDPLTAEIYCEACKKMTMQQVYSIVVSDRKLTKVERMAIEDQLMAWAWSIGEQMDRLKGINSYDGPIIGSFTRNRRSFTYKLRKAVGYTTP